MESEEKPDIKHRDMLNEFIEEMTKRGWEMLDSEVHYHYYGMKGYVDVVLGKGDNLLVCELKPELIYREKPDLGKTMRQVNQAKESFVKARPEFSKFKKREYPLVLRASDENIDLCEEYINLLRNINIVFFDKDLEKEERFNRLYNEILGGKQRIKIRKLCVLCGNHADKGLYCYSCYSSIGK